VVVRFEFPFVSRGLFRAMESNCEYAVERRKDAEKAARNAALQAQVLRGVLVARIAAASEASSAAAMATALREDLQARGIDLTRELARHEGSTP
jgi:hypothetical protein